MFAPSPASMQKLHRPISGRAFRFLLRSSSTRSHVIVRAASEFSLKEWVTKSGGFVSDSLDIVRTDGSGYGLTVSSDVDAGTKLIGLPRQCQLTYDDSSDPKLLAVINKIPSELWGGKLALQLIAQRVKGPDSHFAPYIQALPLGFNGIPIFFGREGQEAIQYPPVAQQVKKRCRWLHDFSKQLQDTSGSEHDPFEGVGVDINALGWALSAVTSRAFRVRGPSHPAALLPLIDMANHSFDANCKVLPITDDKGAVGMYAQKKIRAGEPLLLNYGSLSNDFLFMDYGFVISGNPHDRVALRWDIELLEAAAEVGKARGYDGKLIEKITLAPWKRRWLEQVELAGSNANLEVTLGGQDFADPRLLAALRVVLAQSEKEIKNRSVKELGNIGRPLNRSHETAVLRVLTGMALISMASFQTSLDHDRALLQGMQPSASESSEALQPLQEPLAPDVRAAVAFRVCKKQVLSDVVKGLGERLQSLKTDTSIPASNNLSGKEGEHKGFGSKSRVE